MADADDLITVVAGGADPLRMAPLLAAGADPNAVMEDGNPVLVGAVCRDSPTAVALLLEAGANPNATRAAKGHSTASALMLAGGADQAEAGAAMTRCLLRFGADVHAVDNTGNTALHWAATFGNTEAVGALLGAGADPEARTHQRLMAVQMTSNAMIRSMLHAAVERKALAAAAGLNDAAPTETTGPRGPRAL